MMINSLRPANTRENLWWSLGSLIHRASDVEVRRVVQDDFIREIQDIYRHSEETYLVLFILGLNKNTSYYMNILPDSDCL